MAKGRLVHWVFDSWSKGTGFDPQRCEYQDGLTRLPNPYLLLMTISLYLNSQITLDKMTQE